MLAWTGKANTPPSGREPLLALGRVWRGPALLFRPTRGHHGRTAVDARESLELMAMLTHLGLFVGALVLMEGVAYLAHKYVMHGWLWCLHRSHHAPRRGLFEWNDLFAVFFATPSVVLIYLGTSGHPPALAAGLGIAGYGLVYFVFHDVIVHRRIAHGWRPRNTYLRRIVHAHRLHHATRERDGAVSFGFVYAPPVPVLRARMRAMDSEAAA